MNNRFVATYTCPVKSQKHPSSNCIFFFFFFSKITPPWSDRHRRIIHPAKERKLLAGESTANPKKKEMTLGTTTTATQAYGEASYWDNRYALDDGPFDWYQKYPSLAPLLRLYTSLLHRVLVVGCGNSAFSEGMVDDGYGDVVNIDISSVVIEAMQKKYSNRPQLKYSQMDVCDMNAFQTGSFDAVIDKGTLDSLLCGNNSRINAAKMLEEVGRVLKDKGVYILITYGAPIYRLRLLKESWPWMIKLHVIDKLLPGESSGQQKWELTSPIPLDDDGNSLEAAIGKNPDVHFIYVCIKDDS